MKDPKISFIGHPGKGKTVWSEANGSGVARGGRQEWTTRGQKGVWGAARKVMERRLHDSAERGTARSELRCLQTKTKETQISQLIGSSRDGMQAAANVRHDLAGRSAVRGTDPTALGYSVLTGYCKAKEKGIIHKHGLVGKFVSRRAMNWQLCSG